MWIATQYGLSRFDGKKFTNFSKNDLQGYRLAGLDIRGMAIDKYRHLIWVLPGGYGVNSINLLTSRVSEEIKIGYNSNGEFGLTMVLEKDRLWIGTSMGLRIFNITNGNFEEDFYKPQNIKSINESEVNCIYVDNNHNVWCFYTGFGFVIYDGNSKEKIKEYRLEFLKLFDNNEHIRVNTCVPLSKHELLIGTERGIRKIFYNNTYDVSVDNRPCSTLPSLNTESIEAMCKMHDGKYLIAGHSQLFQFDSLLSEFTLLKDLNNIDGEWLRSVQSIYSDKLGNVWMGCQQGLALMKYGIFPFKPLYLDEIHNRRLDHVRSIYVLKNGDLLAGLRNGIALIDSTSNTFLLADSNHLYHHIYKDRYGLIHAARTDGMFLYDSGKLTPVEKKYKEFKTYSQSPINSHLFLKDSLAILGTENDNGILVWNYRNHTMRNITISSKPSLSSNVVNNIFKDRRQRIWVLSDQQVSILSPDLKKIQYAVFIDPTSDREINLLFDMCEANGSYWIAAYGTGIIELDSSLKVKRIINTVSGLSDNGVYQIFPTPKGLVITSDNGLTLFNPEENSFKRYYQADGLHSNSFEEVCGVMKNGLIYAGGVKGFTIIDPSKFTTNTIPPKTYINRVLIERADNAAKIDTTNIELKQLEVPSDALQVSLYFSGINYSNADRTTFAYRIKEHDKNWVNIGTQNYINLIGLPPGTYQLEVRAANEDNVWSKPVALTLVYLPKWYQTWTFKIALVLLALGLGYLGYRIRISQILKQQKIRRDVASDLHDDIGSSLNSVKVFAHLAKANPAEQDYIANIEDNLEQATVGLRDMIWVLDDNRDSVADLCNRLSQYAAKPAEAIGIEVHMITDGVGDMTLPKTAKRNLFLIAKECINNCVKYAGCKNVWLTVRLQSKKLVFIVKDDGCGFDEAKITEGYGLTNIRNRAEQIGFSCTIVSGATGTEITITEK